MGGTAGLVDEDGQPLIPTAAGSTSPATDDYGATYTGASQAVERGQQSWRDGVVHSAADSQAGPERRSLLGRCTR